MILKQRNDRIIKDCPKAILSNAVAIGATALSVYSNTNFSGSRKHVFIGVPGALNSEIVTFTSVTGGLVVNVSATVYAHPMGTPIYLIDANQVDFQYGATLNAVFASLAKVNINAEAEFTTYNDTSHTTGFGKAQFWNSTAVAAAFGTFWEVIRYDSGEKATRGQVKQDALDEMNATIDGYVIKEDFLDRMVTQCDRRLREEKITWKEETNELVLPTSVGKSIYDLTTYIKDVKTKSSIQFAKIYDQEITIVEQDVFLERVGSAARTELAAPVALVDVTVTVADARDLPDSGSITIGVDTLEYTSKNNSTGVLSGVTGITVVHALGDEVWQSAETGMPFIGTIVDGELHTYPVINEEADSKNIIIIYTKQYTPVTLDSDELAFPGYLYTDFLKVKIAERTGDKDISILNQAWERDVIKYKIKDFSAAEVRFTPDKRSNLYPQSRRGSLR